MINYRSNKRNRKKFRPVFNVSSPPMFAQFVKTSFARPKARSVKICRSYKNDSMFHVCFAVYDKAGHYSKFLGTTICSLFENTKLTSLNQPSITIHILHDNTLTEDNRNKLIQLIKHYNQIVKFYDVEELCEEKFAQITEFFPNVNNDRHSIATFYRFFIQYLLPKEIEKVLYLDADIIVNLDFIEFWQIELGDKPFAAVPEFYQISDEKVSLELRKKSITICKEGVVNPEDYFNAGVMLMNLKVLREEEETILAGMKFISENPQFTFLDQDILNYCFSTSYLKLPTKFNRFVLYAKRENEWDIQEKLYHYAASRICFVMDSRDPYNQLFMKYFTKTPWVDADTKVALSGGIPSQKNYPISVIIPLYNEEEYIGETLDSLLLQTFQAFEVIVVDDCSTDNSVEIVESYKEKFNGRLQLAHTEKNSGTGGYVSRNIGLKIAQGDYTYILDGDDMILPIALETFYSAAILYNADVVYTKTCYFLNAPNDISLFRDGRNRKSPSLNTEFTIDDPNKNIDLLLSEDGTGEFNTIQTLFCRREFLLDNKLFFPEIARSGDFLWIANLYCYIKRFLRISTPLCLRRHYNENSITRKVREPQEQYLFWFMGFMEFAKTLYELKKGNELLTENPLYDLTILKKNLVWSLDRTDDARKELGNEELFKVLHSEFSKNFSGSLASVLPFFFTFIDAETRTNEYYSEIINKFNRYFTARVDIKFLSTEGDFQIVSVSDNKAVVRKPPFLQKNGIGYQIQSYASSMEIVVKATADGQIRLDFKSLDIRDSNNKRVPYWIDYINLTINGQMIFNNIKSVWHDKSYIYTLDVKADEEITIQTEWLPHRSEALKPVKPIVSKFLPYLTSRIDVKLLTKGKGDFQIVSVSDDKADIRKPAWFQKDGIGYQIQSHNGNMEIVAKATANGKIQLSLKGMDVPDPKNKSKRAPYWIDYTKLTVNGKVIFDTLTPAWHDKSYDYSFDAKAGKEIKIQTEWLPHKGEEIKPAEAIDKNFSSQQGETYFKIILDKLIPTRHNNAGRYMMDVKNSGEIAIQMEWLPHSGEVPILPTLPTPPPPPTLSPPPPPPPPVVIKEVEPIVDKFLPYLTSRVDVKLLTKGKGDFKIISVSDDKADIRKPAWFQKDGIGYQIQSHNGNMEIVAKATANGKIQLNLKGMNIPDPKDKSKRLPYWIDYTKLTVNGQTIFNKLTPTWHDKAYNYSFNVKAGEEIKFQVEWLPHKGEAPASPPPPPPPPPPVVIKELEPIVDKFLPYLTSRVDVKLLTKGKGDFKIISVSDDKADIRKPAWFQKDGIGYQIQSHNGNMEIVAKATANGKIQLNLKGMNIPDPKDKSKRLPYWIDYTKLTVNGQTIFDELTPTWHDESYDYSFDVKAGEEIKFQVEWLPHKGEAPASPPPPPPPPPPVVIKELEPIVDKFLPYLTSRVDVKLLTKGKGDFKIISVSDDKADIRKPAWFQKDGIGYQIQSHNGNMEIIAKATADGQIQLNLKGMNIPDPKNKSKRLPYWIDYTKLTVNGQTIFDELTPTWHDKSYKYTLEVKAGEEIKIQTEWLPHRSE